MSKIGRRDFLSVTTPLAAGLAAGAGVAAAERPRRTGSGARPSAAPRGRSPREKFARKFFPNVVLTTHEGKKVRFYDDLIKDRIVTINFMYANCENICPPITANLVKVQRLLGDVVGRELFMYSLSLYPEQDTPEVLRHYVEMHRIGPGWTFLTGAAEDIELLRQRLGFTDPDPEIDKDTSNHIGNVRYGNEPLVLWSGCPGMAEPAWIAESIAWVVDPPGRAGAARRHFAKCKTGDCS